MKTVSRALWLVGLVMLVAGCRTPQGEVNGVPNGNTNGGTQNGANGNRNLPSSAPAPIVPNNGAAGGPKIEVYFSPKGGATEAIVRELGTARRQVLINAYSFTSPPIQKAVVNAHSRGVEVRAILDESQETANYSSAAFLVNAGVPVLIDHKHAIAHSKIMVIDQATIITGSFNFTRSAEEKNAENLLVIKNAPNLVREYVQNWNNNAKICRPYDRANAAARDANGKRLQPSRND